MTRRTAATDNISTSICKNFRLKSASGVFRNFRAETSRPRVDWSAEVPGLFRERLLGLMMHQLRSISQTEDRGSYSCRSQPPSQSRSGRLLRIFQLEHASSRTASGILTEVLPHKPFKFPNKAHLCLKEN